jgi:hypothetical protein
VSSYIYRTYSKKDREWHFLDSLGNDYFARSLDKKKAKVSLTISNDVIEKVDKYRLPLGLSRSRYIDYVINEHFTIVTDE